MPVDLLDANYYFSISLTVNVNELESKKEEPCKTNNHNEHQKVVKTDEFEPPDGGYGWVIVIVSFLGSTVVDGIVNSFGIYLAELVKEFGESEGKITWVGSILAGVTLLVGPLASAMANKFGYRITFITGSVLTSAALGVSIFCPTLTLLMVVYFIAGVGLGFILLPSVVFVGYYFESKRALATGIALSGSGFGTFVFPPVVNYIVQNSNWKIANLALAGTSFCCIIFGLLMKPLKPKVSPSENENNFLMIRPELRSLQKNEESKSTIDVSFSNMAEYMVYKHKNRQKLQVEMPGRRNRSQSNVGEYYASRRKGSLLLPSNHIFYSGSLMQLNILPQRIIRSSSSSDIKCLLKDKKFILFGLLNIFAMISFYIPLVFIVESAKTKNIEAGQASFLISIIGLVNTIARTAFGYLVNFPMVDSIFVNNVCLLIGAAAGMMIPYSENFITYILVSILFGISLAGYSSLTTLILVDILGIDQLTNSFGIILLLRGITALVGTPMGGALLDWTHSYSVPFVVGGGFFLFSTIFGFILQFTNTRSSRVSATEINSIT